MTAKTCKQCGEIKPVTQFRSYYGNRKGTYTMCRSCEKINSRAKYLEKKSSLTELERIELNKIYALYDAQQACGLQPPRRSDGKSTSLTDNLDDMIAAYAERANQVTASAGTLDTKAVPVELREWLTAELTQEPDYYMDEVYEDLKAKYRPVLRINPQTLLPDYDDTHRDALEAILARFNDYEDHYYD